ncbi:hypothetical protein N7495_002495 [Penicillium taxi]|uniref:uncharacterized protein n=1 Tax=Penicillium taxi TaxID=168475 RepID=UPI0025453997|nr:uncharacterized protein N7495_002495 [Penicillium taxi]KAJ5901967.1 hypothetical protein N7495_002495 [Penicillium taxi]
MILANTQNKPEEVEEQAEGKGWLDAKLGWKERDGVDGRWECRRISSKTLRRERRFRMLKTQM